MKKKTITKVSKKVGIDCKRNDLVGKNIVFYENDMKHCYNRHYKDFDNPKDFSFVINHLDYIIDECDFVLFNNKNQSLEYYKKLNNNITVRVKVENSNELKIKTFFRIPEEKYELKKNRSIYNKYVIQDSEEELISQY